MRNTRATVALLGSVTALGVILSACGSDETIVPPAESVARDTNPETELPLPSGWTTYRDSQHGFSVSYPSDWHRAEETLTPNLLDPNEILSLGTFPLRAGGDRCAHFPENAIEDLGPEDAFISVQERAPPYPARGYPPRPAPFTPTLTAGGNVFCVEDPTRLEAWIPFSDANRAFYLMIAVGPSASDETRAEVFAVVECLRFDERREVNRAEIAPSPSEPACIPRGNGHARICVINETPTRTHRRKLELARSGSGAEPAEG